MKTSKTVVNKKILSWAILTMLISLILLSVSTGGYASLRPVSEANTAAVIQPQIYEDILTHNASNIFDSAFPEPEAQKEQVSEKEVSI